ncbi:hypothetical protein ACFLY9_00355 [Patescibacteria group bacterium]
MELVPSSQAETYQPFTSSNPIENRESTLSHITFEGLTPDQQSWVSARLLSSGLPLDNVDVVRYSPNSNGRELWLGSWEQDRRTFTLYKSLERIPLISQGGVIAHEGAHACSPLKEGNENLFASPEDIVFAREHAEAVAIQTLATRKYLSGYHKALHNALELGEINWIRFCEETHAILVEQRMTNLNHLLQVEESQVQRMKQLGHDQTQITSLRSGVDRTLISLIDGVDDAIGLETHIQKFRQSLTANASPLKAPLAA